MLGVGTIKKTQAGSSNYDVGWVQTGSKRVLDFQRHWRFVHLEMDKDRPAQSDSWRKGPRTLQSIAQNGLVSKYGILTTFLKKSLHALVSVVLQCSARHSVAFNSGYISVNPDPWVCNTWWRKWHMRHKDQREKAFKKFIFFSESFKNKLWINAVGKDRLSQRNLEGKNVLSKKDYFIEQF